MKFRAPGLVLLSAAAALRAQDPAVPPPVAPSTANWIALDRVVATVNDAVILESEVVTLTIGDIRTLEQELGRPLSPGERQARMRIQLGRKIDQHALAQASKTLGILPPDRVEAVLQDMLREEEIEQVREFGTYQRLTEERARQSRSSSWQAIEREQRVTKLADLTRQMAVSVRLQNQRNLFITPRMMRDFYRKNRAQFVHDSRAVLGSIGFAGSDAAAAAAAARTVWEQEDLTPDELVARFADRGAYLPESLLIDEQARKSRRPDQIEFALAGPKGHVSAPVPSASGDELRLWKVLDFAAARNDPFDSPEVQRQIRDQMEHEVIERMLQQTTDRARQRTEVWQLGEMDRG